MAKRCVLVGLAAVLLLGSLARAQEQAAADDFARIGPYLGLGYVYAVEDFEINTGASNSSGIDARAGMRINPFLAAELDFQYYDKFDCSCTVPQPVLAVKGWSFGANLKAYGMTGRIQPYGLAGIAGLNLDVRSFSPAIDERTTVAAGRVGAGVDVYATRNVVVNIETSYLIPSSDLGRFALLPINMGIQWRFDVE